MKRGTFISIDGIDGAGKSTQAERLANALAAAGCNVIRTREPTDGPAGTRIRELSMRGSALDPDRELALFMEDRRQHANQLLIPSLESGAVLLSDRYFLSSVAYQGARGLSPERILADNEHEFPLPDLALLLVVPSDEALRRVRDRGDPLNRSFERADFLERVAAIFASLERPYIERIPGGGDPDAVHERILEVTRRRLRLPG